MTSHSAVDFMYITCKRSHRPTGRRLSCISVPFISCVPGGGGEHVLGERHVVEARVLGAQARQRRRQPREQARRRPVRRHCLQARELQYSVSSR